MPRRFAGNIYYWPDGTWVEENSYKPEAYSFKGPHQVLRLDQLTTECTVSAMVYGMTGNEEKLEELNRGMAGAVRRAKHHVHEKHHNRWLEQALEESNGT